MINRGIQLMKIWRLLRYSTMIKSNLIKASHYSSPRKKGVRGSGGLGAGGWGSGIGGIGGSEDLENYMVLRENGGGISGL